MEFHKDDYIKYRLEKADETMDAAKLLIENQKWNSAINRLYYACFYAVTALLVTHGLKSKSHSGVKTAFFMNYIKNGKIDHQFGQLYTDLFDWRQKGDYGDFFDFDKDLVLPLLPKCTKLIDNIKTLIKGEI